TAPPGAGCARPSDQSPAGRTAHAGRGLAGPRCARVSAQGRDSSVVRSASKSSTTDTGEEAEPDLGERCDLPARRSSMVVFGSRVGSVLKARPGVEARVDPRREADPGGGRGRAPAATAGLGIDLSQRPGKRVPGRSIPKASE